jgi:hypothetical protein
MDYNTLRGLAGGGVIIVGIYYCYVISMFAVRLSREKSKVYGTQEPSIPFIGLILPAPYHMKRPQDISYRKFYFREQNSMLFKSIALWAIMILLSQI